MSALRSAFDVLCHQPEIRENKKCADQNEREDGHERGQHQQEDSEGRKWPESRHMDTIRTALVERPPLSAASLDVLWRDNFRLAAGSFVGWVI